MNKEHTLQLKDITPYLPYELKGVTDFLPNTVFIVDSISANRIKGYTEQGNNVPLGCTFKEFKPYLRNLSDLTKEIEVNGERFVPADVIGINTKHPNYETFIRDHNSLTYTEVEMMISWHFDVFGLIDKGLAIDINTITNG